MTAWLWENQALLTDASVREAARNVGLVNDMATRYADVLELVRQDVEIARQVGVRGTPTYFLNGVVLPFGPKETFDMALRHELRIKTGR